MSRTRLREDSQKTDLGLGLSILLTIVLILVGLVTGNNWLVLISSAISLLLSLWVLYPVLKPALSQLSQREWTIGAAFLGAILASLGLAQVGGLIQRLRDWYNQLDWNQVGAIGGVLGAIGQILIAVLAVYVAWRQYIISRDLTIQQNLITQQQTIDAYFQGIAELVIDEEGLLEDWPQERAIAEGRTAAILSSIDANGKAKVLRFLSRSGLLTPLKRDLRLGRPILNGVGGYAEDRSAGIRVINLSGMLVRADLFNTDLRQTDLSESNLSGTNLSYCELDHANLARTILSEASFAGADLRKARLFYGSVETATPRTRNSIPNYETGENTGAIVRNTDLTQVRNLSEEQRYYCCSWGGSKTRSTIPGGCQGIPNRLEHLEQPELSKAEIPTVRGSVYSSSSNASARDRSSNS